MECSSATITIGGAPTRAAAAALAAACREDGFAYDELAEAAGQGAALEIAHNDRPWATFPNIEHACQEQGLPFQVTFGARTGEWEAGVRWWTPGMGAPATCQTREEGGPTVVSATAVRRVLDDESRSTDERLDRLRALVDAVTPPTVPPFVVPPFVATPAVVRGGTPGVQAPTPEDLAQRAGRVSRPVRIHASAPPTPEDLAQRAGRVPVPGATI